VASLDFITTSLPDGLRRDGLPSNNVRSIYEDPPGVLWIGTYDGGLGRYSEGHWTSYTQKNGLFDNGVFQTLEDSRGNLWMSSNRGIYRVSKQQLNDVAAGKRKDVITASYGRADGMMNSECNGGLWPAGAKTRTEDYGSPHRMELPLLNRLLSWKISDLREW
jgi:ligand-binding sensor domain-containing protein